MGYNYFHVDAFVGEGLRGNPAGVCLLPGSLPTEQMQAIAAELLLPETSFVYPDGDRFALRWFTPLREVDLCGHATLATAAVIFQQLDKTQDALAFSSASGELWVRRDNQDRQRLVLDFPARPAQRIAEPVGLAALLGVTPYEVWQAKARMVVLANEQQVRALRPDIPALIDHGGIGVIVTAPGEQVDFVSRYFSLDRSEDPVTGSAHCTLMPYWSERLGRTTLRARQISARGGELFCQQSGERTLIAGYAQIFMRGEIALG